MKTVFGAFFRAVTWVLMIILLFFVLSGLYQRTIGKDPNAGLFGIGYATVVSGSMKPMLNEGDFLVYQRQPADRYEVNDVVIYVRDGGSANEKLISHRVVSIDGNTVIVKGDANEIADDPIVKDQIVGRMVFYIPKLGAAAAFLRTPAGYVCLCAVIVLLIVLNVLTIRKEKKERVEMQAG